MTRTVTATEAKNKLGSLLRLVSKAGDVVVIENRRERTAIIVSPDDYDELQAFRKEKKRREALESLLRYQEIYSSANIDLSDQEIEEIAERATRDVIEELVESGKIRLGES